MTKTKKREMSHQPTKAFNRFSDDKIRKSHGERLSGVEAKTKVPAGRDTDEKLVCSTEIIKDLKTRRHQGVNIAKG